MRSLQTEDNSVNSSRERRMEDDTKNT